MLQIVSAYYVFSSLHNYCRFKHDSLGYTEYSFYELVK